MTERPGCGGCRSDEGFDRPLAMAFQPIVDLSTRTVLAYEALLRGADGAGAEAILAQVTDANRYAFDQRCRVSAIECAARLDLPATGALLSVNFLPGAVYQPAACIRATLAAARRMAVPVEGVMFEVSERERVDADHLLAILTCYRELGFRTAIDDFGAGFSGLELLSRFQPDVVKLDMALVRDVDAAPVKRAILGHVAAMLRELSILAVCEGVETEGERAALADLGLEVLQGNLLARPAVGALPPVAWPADG